MARVPKVEPFDLPPAVRDVPGRAAKPAGGMDDRGLVRRAQGEEQARLVITAGEKENPGPDISERIVARERVERLLEGLDERDRLMLILKEVEGFSIEEIAEVLNLNGNTVKVRLFRARRRVVNQAKKRGD